MLMSRVADQTRRSVFLSTLHSKPTRVHQFTPKAAESLVFVSRKTANAIIFMNILQNFKLFRIQHENVLHFGSEP